MPGARPRRFSFFIAAFGAVISLATTAFGEPAQRVRLGYFANVTHAQAVLGVSGGDFERAVSPSRFSSRVFNAGPSLIEALFAGEIDIGYVGPSPALSAHIQSRGRGIRVIAGAAANGVVIVARPGSGISSLEDLRQRRIATPQLGNTQDISARHYLLHVLGAPNVDNVIPIANAEQGALMDRGRIDAAWAVEPWASRLQIENGAVVIAEEKDLWPGGEFTLTIVVVSPEFLRDHAQTVEAVLRVHAELTARLAREAQGQAAPLSDALEALTGKRLTDRVVASALARVKFTTRPLRGSLDTFAAWAYEMGFARGMANVQSLVDTTILDRIEGVASPEDPGAPRAATPARGTLSP